MPHRRRERRFDASKGGVKRRSAGGADAGDGMPAACQVSIDPTACHDDALMGRI
jgi:hypothetical protein